MYVEFIRVGNGPEAKLADAEILFDEKDCGGLFSGLKLIGFSIWKGERGHYVTLPARPFNVGNDRAYFNFLRTINKNDKKSIYRFNDWLLKEWKSPKAVVRDPD